MSKRKYTHFLCIKNFYMKNKALAFTVGKYYKIKSAYNDEIRHYIIKSNISDSHVMPWDNEIKQCFKLSIKLEVI